MHSTSCLIHQRICGERLWLPLIRWRDRATINVTQIRISYRSPVPILSARFTQFDAEATRLIVLDSHGLTLSVANQQISTFQMVGMLTVRTSKHTLWVLYLPNAACEMLAAPEYLPAAIGVPDHITVTNDIRVITGATLQHVTATSTDQNVISLSSDQRVVSSLPQQQIVIGDLIATTAAGRIERGSMVGVYRHTR